MFVPNLGGSTVHSLVLSPLETQPFVEAEG